MERLIARQGDHKPRLLLHSCCGPCSSSVLERLSLHFRISLLWYNPNIYPEEEFNKRREALEHVLRDMGLEKQVELICLPWRSEDYEKAVVGLEEEPEGGRRCPVCFRLRLEEAARYAAKEGYDYFCTTLSLSRHKDSRLINSIGEAVAAEQGVAWLPSDFKKKNGENRSIELCQKYDVYRQLYCGCRFSLEKRQSIAAQAEEIKAQNEGGTT